MTTVGEYAAGAALEIVVFGVVFGLLYRLWARFFPVPVRQTVLMFQKGIVLRGGAVEKVVGPGRYWITPSRKLLVCDMRPKPFQVALREYKAADNMIVRVSLVGDQHITDPALIVTESSNPFGAFNLAMQQALQTAVGEMQGQAILLGREALAARIRTLLEPRAAQLGVDVSRLEVFEAIQAGWLKVSAPPGETQQTGPPVQTWNNVN